MLEIATSSAALWSALALLLLLHLLTQSRDPLHWISSAPSLPIFGSAPLLPRQGGGLRWQAWARSSRDASKAPQGLLRLELFTQRFVLVTSPALARTLFNGGTRRQTLSGRPTLAMIQDSQSLTGHRAHYYAFMTMNADFKRHRWAAMNLFNEARRRGYWGRIEMQCSEMLRAMVGLDPVYASQTRAEAASPRCLLEAYSSSTITSLVFGDASAATSARLRSEAGEFLNVLAPASYIVNLVPQLQWLPRTVNPWKRYEEKRWQRQCGWFRTLWQNFVKRYGEVKREEANCFAAVYQASKVMCDTANDADQEDDHSGSSSRRPALGLRNDEDATWCLGMSMLPGAYTVSSSLSTILRALVTFPEVQRNLQEELDEYLCARSDEHVGVVGKHRIPIERDALSLPYLQAFLRECQRWRPVIPTGIPHQVMQDEDIWVKEDGEVLTDPLKARLTTAKRHLLPAGTILFAPEYLYSRDEGVYADPGRFDPSRWLTSETAPWVLREPASAPLVNATAFGWGARRCPGANLAQYQLHVATLGLLWLFDFTLSKNSETEALLNQGLAEGERRGGMTWPREWRESGMIPREVEGRCPVERVQVKVRRKERLQILLSQNGV